MSDLRTSVDPGFPNGPFDLSRLIESAAHCRLNDVKRPGLVGLPTLKTTQVCPDDLTKPSDVEGVAEGTPPNWFVRVVFDELLDPNVEDLVPQLDAMMHPTGIMLGTLANTQPVTLKCDGVDVPYGGYYVPNGNRVSWPLGPALFIQPTSATSVKTGASCEVGVKDMVHNKKGDPVPSDQRSFPFKIAPMKLRFAAFGPKVAASATVIDPDSAADGSLELDPADWMLFYWTAAFVNQANPINAPVDPAEIHIFEGTDATVCASGGTAVATTDIETAPGGTTATTNALAMILDLKSQGPMNAWKASTTYRIEFTANAKITPKQGGADGTFPAGFKLCFHTTAAM